MFAEILFRSLLLFQMLLYQILKLTVFKDQYFESNCLAHFGCLSIFYDDSLFKTNYFAYFMLLNKRNFRNFS